MRRLKSTVLLDKRRELQGVSLAQIGTFLLTIGFLGANPVAAKAQATLQRANAEAPWTGAYAGAAFGLSSQQFLLTTAAPTVRATASPPRLAGFAGVQVQRGNLVFGMEADVGTVSSSRQVHVVFAPNDILAARSYGGIAMTGRLRLGHVFGPALLHGSVGLGAVTTRFNVTDGISSASSKLTIPVWALGVGVDYALTEHLFVRADLMAKRSTSISQEIGGLGDTSIRYLENTAKVGLGLRF